MPVKKFKYKSRISSTNSVTNHRSLRVSRLRENSHSRNELRPEPASFVYGVGMGNQAADTISQKWSNREGLWYENEKRLVFAAEDDR